MAAGFFDAIRRVLGWLSSPPVVEAVTEVTTYPRCYGSDDRFHRCYGTDDRFHKLIRP